MAHAKNAHILSTPIAVRDAPNGPWFDRGGALWTHLESGRWSDRHNKVSHGGAPSQSPLDAAHMRALFVANLGLRRIRPGLIGRTAGRIRNCWTFNYNVYVSYLEHYAEMSIPRKQKTYPAFMRAYAALKLRNRNR